MVLAPGMAAPEGEVVAQVALHSRGCDNCLVCLGARAGALLAAG
jgi:hypothetical protein